MGRPRRWCSQACRRAAYEERRAAASGAIGVRVVERIVATDHDLTECVRRVMASPTACRRILRGLLEPTILDELDRELRWGPVRRQALDLAAMLLQREQARQPRLW